MVRAAADRAGIAIGKVSPHWMRHAHATHALDNGEPISLVQQTLGHKSVATTGRYLHVRPNTSTAFSLRAAQKKRAEKKMYRVSTCYTVGSERRDTTSPT